MNCLFGYRACRLARGKRLISILLASLLLLAACGCGASPREDAQSSPEPIVFAPLTRENVTFSEMEYARPDIEMMRAQMDDLMDGVHEGKDPGEMMAQYQSLQAQYAHADSMMALAYLLYAFDVTEPYYREEYAFLQSELSKLDMDMTEVSIALFESSDEARLLAQESFGEEYVETIYEEEDLNNEAVQALLDEDEALTLIYDELLATFTMLDNGRRWTLDDIKSDTELDNDEFYRLYDRYCFALNERVGGVFLKQLAIRSQIAQKLGYGSYAAYRYDCYGRDYTILDTQRLHASVKRHIVPIFIKANEALDSYDLYCQTYEQAAFLEQLALAARDFSPLMGEALDYMLLNELFDFTVRATKMKSSFTTYLSDYRAPFIFTQWTDSASDITTVLHELGHYANYYHNADAGYSASDSLDLAEVDSQALVLLMSPYYASFYGELGEMAVADQVVDAMYALITGCMEDEFQQRIYSDPAITLDEINALYKRLAAEYGLDAVYGYAGTEWVLVTHTFQTPMYYISYAVSIAAALELYERAQTDSSGARQAYLDILCRPAYASFRETLKQNGLTDVFSDGAIMRLAGFLSTYAD